MIHAKHISYQVQDRMLFATEYLEMETGRFHGIIGPNGAGKSTLMRLLSGLRQPTKGMICWNNENIQNLNPQQKAARRAILSQQQDSPFDFTVREIVLMGRIPHYSVKPQKKDFEAVDALLETFQLKQIASRSLQSLSGGERQRVHLARVLAQIYECGKSEPFRNKLLFLDEPGTWLDVSQQHQFMEKMQEFTRGGLTVIAILHELDLTARYADCIHLLGRGRLIKSGNANDVFVPKLLSEAYGAPLQVCIDQTGCLHVIPEHLFPESAEIRNLLSAGPFS